MRPTRTTTAEARSGRLRAALAVPIRSCSRRGLPCRRRCRRRGALLPHPFTLARGFPRGYGPGGARAVCFLWHCLRGRPRRALPGTVPPWSPDFPLRRSEAAARPSGALRFYPEAAPPVNMAGAAPALPGTRPNLQGQARSRGTNATGWPPSSQGRPLATGPPRRGCRRARPVCFGSFASGGTCAITSAHARVDFEAVAFHVVSADNAA